MAFALASGSSLLHYRVVAPLGAGGMGEVYRALDTTLGREVAIKVLPAGLTADPERLARLEREARLLASLNHPNIAAVYGLHEQGGTRFLALELVPGETLADRLRRGALPLDEAIAIARQIAEALAAAHDQGVVHRDLKPANVQVTAEGRVKVLDFGLAKGIETAASDLGHSPTLSHFGATVDGMILGTAGYMSPEQARGRPVDRRADVWAFGCVLWEMLTGHTLFAGETVSDTLAAVLRAEPVWGELPPGTPPALRRLLHHCLERDPGKRLRDLADARLELDDAALAEASPSAVASAGASPAPGARARLPWALAGVALALALLALGALAWTLGRRAPAPATAERALRFTIADPPLAEQENSPRLALSPDGDRLFWVGQKQGRTILATRRLGELAAQEVAGSEDVEGIAAVAPDGERVAIVRAQSIEWLGLRGGAPARQARVTVFRGAALAADGALWFSPSTESGILREGRDGRDPAPIVLPDGAAGERSFRWPTLLPGGEVVLFTVATADLQSFTEARIEAYSTRTKRRTVVVENATYPIFLAPDRLFFVRSGGLFAARLDLARLALAGEPRLVQDGVGDDALSGLADLALAADGTLAYVPGGVGVLQRRLVELGRDGATRPIAAERDPYQRISVSPDGKTVAVDIDAAGAQLWLVERERGTRVRLTHSWSNNFPVWSRDGQTIYYFSGRGGRFGVFAQRLDGSPPTAVFDSEFTVQPLAVSPDGGRLLVTRSDGAQNDLWELPLAGGAGAARALVTSRYDELRGGYSPDGRWLVFSSDESGEEEVYLEPLPGPGRKLRVSTAGGDDPRFSPDGREILFVGGPPYDELFAAKVALGAEPTVERPRRLAKLDGPIYDFDPFPDGRLAVVISPPADAKSPPFVVARGWDTPPRP
jgi:serine/threonine-protein kinase